jgi:hypothetical protein
MEWSTTQVRTCIIRTFVRFSKVLSFFEIFVTTKIYDMLEKWTFYLFYCFVLIFAHHINEWSARLQIENRVYTGTSPVASSFYIWITIGEVFY